MRYLGSKTLLLDKIEHLIANYEIPSTFCDPFGGIGTVGSYMKAKGYRVITGDLLNFAHCFQMALVEMNEMPQFEKVKTAIGTDNVEEYLNQQNVEKGWLIEEYAEKRKFFTVKNAKRIQGCINCIDKWKQNNLLQNGEYEILIASIIQSFDKIANTAGTYYAYLKKYYRKAEGSFRFAFLHPVSGMLGCKAYLQDANDLVKKNKTDILYLDPPYNERNYGRYYHLPENVSLGVCPIPTGKSGMFVYHKTESAYNKKLKATVAFEELIRTADTKCIIFHYTDDGIIKPQDARDILLTKGNVEEFYLDCKGYSTISGEKRTQHHIFRVSC